MKLDHRSYFRVFGALSAALLVAYQSHAQPAAYPTVTDDRLEHPDAGDWLMYRRTYDGSGFSPLKQITPSNIRRLTLAWTVSTDLLGAHETTPIVNRGRMFITTPQNNIIALDAKTGTQLWRYARKYPEGLFQLHPTNRGVALYRDYVYMATTDCALVALDAATGKEVWTVALDDYKTGCYSTLAPLAVRGKIILGYSGGELGVRGSVNAFDAATGKRIWKTYTVPAPNEPGGDSWKGDTFKRGGGSTWITGVYDPVTNTTYWGTGNPGPWVADDRPGDNLYTDSTLALDADTGKLKSYHQYTPHDSWDWDEVSAPLLIDTEVDIAIASSSCTPSRSPTTTSSRRSTRRPAVPRSTSPSGRARNRAQSSARALAAARTGHPRHGARRRNSSTSRRTTTSARTSRKVRSQTRTPRGSTWGTTSTISSDRSAPALARPITLENCKPGT